MEAAMPTDPASLDGKTVKGRVVDWAASQRGDLSAPLYQGDDIDSDGYVTGELAVVDVDVWGGQTRFQVGAYDLDPDTVEEVKTAD
jgi:hypothetical protein